MTGLLMTDLKQTGRLLLAAALCRLRAHSLNLGSYSG